MSFLKSVRRQPRRERTDPRQLELLLEPAVPEPRPSKAKASKTPAAKAPKAHKANKSAELPPVPPFHAKHLALMEEWIIERESVRRKREAGLPAPWTKNEVIANNRFCNVRRMDDKVSLWLLENFYTHKLSPAQWVVAAIVARKFNRPETLIKLCPNGFRMFDYGHFKRVLSKMHREGEQIFTGVYIIAGGNRSQGVAKWEAVLDEIRDINKKLKDGDVDTTSMRNTHAMLLKFKGLGSFLAGQVVADLRHVLPGTWEDRMTWAPIGPGSNRGISLVHGIPVGSMTQARFEQLLANLMERLYRRPKIRAIWDDRKLEAHDLQNCCCETSKYIKIALFNGRARNRYDSSQHSQQELL